MKLTKIIQSLCFLIVLQVECTLTFGQNKPDVFSNSPTANYIDPFNDYSSGIYLNKVVNYRLKKKVTDAQTVNLLASKDVSITSTYFDGLNRPIQNVSKMASPTGKDVIEVMKYDEFGRTIHQLLPYASTTSTGGFKLNAFTEQYNFNTNMYPNDEVFYSKTEINENSLEGEVKMMKPGNSGAGNNIGVTSKVGTNVSNEVRIWNDNQGGIPTSTIYYNEATLIKTESTNEENIKVITYKDKSGNIILSKKQNALGASTTSHAGWNCTYFVYDDYNRMTYSISPKAVEFFVLSNATIWDFNTNMTLLAELCNHSEYDERGRLVSQKMAGKEVEYYVYDYANRLVLIQDGNLRADNNKWKFVKYDVHNRTILNGVFINTPNQNRSSLQSQMMLNSSPANSFLGFLQSFIVTNSYTTASVVPDAYILSINCYDDYSNTPNLPYNDVYVQSLQGGTNAETHIKSNETFGLQTGGYTRVIDGDNVTSNWTNYVFYYDENRHLIQKNELNHLNGVDAVSLRYNFSGDVISNSTIVSNPFSTNVPTLNLKGVQSFNNYGYKVAEYLGLENFGTFGYRKISGFDYTQIGQLKTKYLGATAETQSFKYKPWGALESINADYCQTGNGNNFFGEILNYDYGFNNNKLDGALSGYKWRMRGSNNKQRAYGYTYDVAGRLAEGYYSEFSGVVLGNGPVWDNMAENYTAENMSYDANGNILSMKQWGVKMGYAAPFLMDDMTYEYTNNGHSNKLKNVTDNVLTNYDIGEFKELGSNAQGDYLYDDNGNITTDHNKNITSITYNQLNKPSHIVFTNNRDIVFKYSANGTRLSKTITEGTGPNQIVKHIDYLYGAEYENNQLKHAPHTEGRIRPVTLSVQGATQIGFEIDYFVKDHLNNVRSTLVEEWTSNWWDIPLAGDLIDPVSAPPDVYNTGFKGATVGWKDYIVTNELANSTTENATFDNVDATRDYKIGSLDINDVYNTSLNGSDSARLIGPSMVLRVMAGDSLKINTAAKYSIQNANYGVQYTLDDVVNSLIEALSGAGGYSTLNESGMEASVSQGALSNCDFLDRLQQIKNNINNQTDRPQAFLNYIFLDENLNVVPENSGLIQTTTPDQWNDLVVPQMEAKRSGYFFVFLSNESMMNVFFDNLRVGHYKGKLLDESHYYPYGLTLTKSAIVNAPINKTLFCSKTLEKQEFSDGTGLDWYNYDVRAYDPQIGRWHQPDPLAILTPNWTPYRYAYSDPANFSDPSGLNEDIGEETTTTTYYCNEFNSSQEMKKVEIDDNNDGIIDKVTISPVLDEIQDNAQAPSSIVPEVSEMSNYAVSDDRYDEVMDDLNGGFDNEVSGDDGIQDQEFDFFSGSAPQIVNNTQQAKDRYFYGDGSAVELGPKVISAFLNSSDFRKRDGNIVFGRTTDFNGNFGVNMTYIANMFFMGDTRVEYDFSCDAKTCVVEYRAFVEDGFWDPNVAAENTLGIFLEKYQPDKTGSNLEWNGGHPYPFKPYIFSKTFKNPGYKPIR